MKTIVTPIKSWGPSMSVLVVEDNVDAGDSLSLLLRLHGHKVRVARTGPTAIELCASAIPDVVLLDIGLPGMDGYQVAKQLRDRKDFQHVLICALTGYTPSEADHRRRLETGFDHYFVKPVDIDKLHDLFRNAARRSP